MKLVLASTTLLSLSLTHIFAATAEEETSSVWIRSLQQQESNNGSASGGKTILNKEVSRPGMWTNFTNLHVIVCVRIVLGQP